MNTTLNSHQLDALTNVYIALLIPSVIGSFSVLVVSLLRWRNLQEQVHLLVQLALADLLAAAVLMSTSVINKTSTDFNGTFCLFGLPLSLTFYVISFLLVVIYAWSSKSAIQGWRTRPAENVDVQSHCRRVYENKVIYILAWSLPLGVYLAYTIPKQYRYVPLDSRSKPECCSSCILFFHTLNDTCSQDGKYHDAFINMVLIFMVVEVLTTCCVIYYQITKWYEARQQQGLFPVEGDGQSRKRFKHVFSTARNMVLVILFCWIPALILIGFLFLKIEQSKLFPLYIIQAVTVSLQGFLNSIVYAWKRPNFTEAVLGERTPLVAYHDHVSFFEESLRITVWLCSGTFLLSWRTDIDCRLDWRRREKDEGSRTVQTSTDDTSIVVKTSSI